MNEVKTVAYLIHFILIQYIYMCVCVQEIVRSICFCPGPSAVKRKSLPTKAQTQLAFQQTSCIKNHPFSCSLDLLKMLQKNETYSPNGVVKW